MPDIELVPTRVTEGPGRRVRARARPWARRTSSSTSATRPTTPSAKKREEVLDREKPFDQLRYLKEDAKQKDAAAGQQKVRRARTPKLSKREAGQGDEAPARTTLTRRRHRSEQAGRGARRPARRRGPGRGEGGLRGPLRPRLRAQGARSSTATRCSRPARAFVEREAPGGGAAHQHRHRRARRRLDPGRHARRRAAGRHAAARPGQEDSSPARPFDLEVTVENKGTEPLSRVRALDRERQPLPRPPRVRLRRAEARREDAPGRCR